MKDINAGKHHREAGRKPLHNVVCVVHDGSDDDARESLHSNSQRIITFRKIVIQVYVLYPVKNPSSRILGRSFVIAFRQQKKHVARQSWML